LAFRDSALQHVASGGNPLFFLQARRLSAARDFRSFGV
jgi:hypothetical protein